MGRSGHRDLGVAPADYILPPRSRLAVGALRSGKRTPGGAFELEDLLDPPGNRFVWPDRSAMAGTGKRPGLGCALYGQRSLGSEPPKRGGIAVAWRRKPQEIVKKSMVSPGGAEAVVRDTDRRRVPAAVRRADDRRLADERRAP
jgi:hypothetical protein